VLFRSSVSAVFPFALSVEQKPENKTEAPGTIIADLSVVMHLEYSLLGEDSPIADEDIPHVVAILGYMHSWPYFRADVQALTTRLGFPPLVLPVIVSGAVPERVLIGRHPIERAHAESSEKDIRAIPETATKPKRTRSGSSRAK